MPYHKASARMLIRLLLLFLGITGLQAGTSDKDGMVKRTGVPDMKVNGSGTAIIQHLNYFDADTGHTETQSEEKSSAVTFTPASLHPIVIDVAQKYGVRADGSDNTEALAKLSFNWQGKGKPFVRLDFSKTGGTLIRYRDNTWLSGIDSFEIYAPGISFQCTYTGPWNDYQGAFYNGGIFIPYPANKGQSSFKGWNTGNRFKTAEAGSKSIQLVNKADAYRYQPGDQIFIAGYEEQHYGYPPNPRYFEWNKVIEVNKTNSIVILEKPLKWSYNEDWKDVRGFFGDAQKEERLGKPRIFALSNYTSYGKFIGLTVLSGSNQPVSWANGAYFAGDSIVWEDCKFQSVLWPSENRFVRYINCEIGPTDLDKNVGVCVFENCRLNSGLSAATGIDSLVLIGNTINARSPLSPRVLYAERNSFKSTDKNPALYAHPEFTRIETVYLKNNKFHGAIDFSQEGQFTALSVNTNEILFADPALRYSAGNSHLIRPVKAIGPGAAIISTDGVTATVKDIIHNGKHFVIKLSNVRGTLRAGQVWQYRLVAKLVDLGGNTSNGRAIRIK
jgi:hypothetical protein